MTKEELIEVLGDVPADADIESIEIDEPKEGEVTISYYQDGNTIQVISKGKDGKDYFQPN